MNSLCVYILSILPLSVTFCLSFMRLKGNQRSKCSSLLFVGMGYVYVILISKALGGFLENFYSNKGDIPFIRGWDDSLTTPWRLTQPFILHRICLPLFGDNLIGYRLLYLGLHIVNAFLVYQLFFILFTTIKSSIRPTWTNCHSGGLIAGSLFLIYNTYAPTWIATFPYLFVTFLSLIALICAILFFKYGHPILWILVTLSYTTALITHIYSFAIPVYIGILEILHRRNFIFRCNLYWTSLRYCIFVVFIGIFLLRYWDYINPIAEEHLDIKLIMSMFFSFPKYLILVFTTFCSKCWNEYNSYLYPIKDIPGLITYIVLFSLCAKAFHQIKQKMKILDIFDIFVLFIIIWNGLFFFPDFLIFKHFGQELGCWRFYTNAVGFSIFISYTILIACRLISMSNLFILKNAPLFFIAVGLPIIIVLMNIPNQNRLSLIEEIMSGNIGSKYRIKKPLTEECLEVESLGMEEVKQVIMTTHNFRCKDLQNIDLSKLELKQFDFRWANLCGANLLEANLEQARMEGAFLLWADLRKANLNGANLEKADLTGADLRDADLRGANLRQAIFRGALMSNADLRGADLSGANLDQYYKEGGLDYIRDSSK